MMNQSTNSNRNGNVNGTTNNKTNKQHPIRCFKSHTLQANNIRYPIVNHNNCNNIHKSKNSHSQQQLLPQVP